MTVDYKQMYQDKLMSLEDAAKTVKSGEVIFASPVTGFPSELAESIASRYEELDNVKLLTVFGLRPYSFLTNPAVAEKIQYETMFMGPLERKLYAKRLFTFNSINFSEMANYVQNRVKPETVIAQVSPMDEEGYFNLGNVGVAITREAVDVAERVIIQVNNELMPINNNAEKKIGAAHVIHISEVDIITEQDSPLIVISGDVPLEIPSDLESQMAEHIVPMIEDGATLQIGFGGLSNAVSYGLVGKVKDCHIHSEMLTESMRKLADEGVVTGKIVGGFSLGSNSLYKWSATDKVEFKPLSVVNDFREISSIDKFYSINATLMVDLTGQITSEAIGTRQVSCVGGAGDFVRGATHSKGGKSFVCVASSYEDQDGKLHSNIVFSLPPATPVTVPRQDIMYIVTEYGVADVYNMPIPERVKRIIAIAHPDFREELTAQAKKVGYIK